MKRFVPWPDIVFFGVIAALTIGMSLLAVFTPQEWTATKIIILSVVDFVMLGLCVLIPIRKWLSKPDYRTHQNVFVWKCSKGPSFADMNHLLETFITGVAEGCTQLGHAQVREILSGVRIEWSDTLVSWYHKLGFAVVDKEGLQQGKTIRVHYRDPVHTSALFHELGHVVRQYAFNEKPDYRHEDTLWWKMIHKIGAAS